MVVKEKILKEVKRIEEDSTYSSKGHFYAAQFWSSLNFWMGIPTTIMAAVAGASALSQFPHHQVIAGALALLVSALSAVSTFINPNEKAARHYSSGNRYNSLRNRTRIFGEVGMERLGDDKLFMQLEKLNTERDELNEKSPQIPKWAFDRAKKGIKDGETQYEEVT